MGEALRADDELQPLEQGEMTFLYRPRVEQQEPHDLGDVQRILLLLSPEGSAFERVIVIGRKRVPRSKRRERFWGYVDLVLSRFDMNAALDAQVYGTKTRGLRHLPAARPFAWGTYDLATHGPHSHLRWTVERVESEDPVAADLSIERNADYIVTIANPDPAAWGLAALPDLQSELFDELEQHVTIPSPFPPPLQSRFGSRKYAQLDSVEWLDHPGAEVVFVGTGD
ncbi:MAG TPA: hypothetical protein VKB93_25835 [Thermoanaerobaculia bacterium]|nr:hypothetical protein [Thermoanaerobaculia bacterium]